VNHLSLWIQIDTAQIGGRERCECFLRPGKKRQPLLFQGLSISMEGGDKTTHEERRMHPPTTCSREGSPGKRIDETSKTNHQAIAD
jgi:hypothetical protein